MQHLQSIGQLEAGCPKGEVLPESGRNIGNWPQLMHLDSDYMNHLASAGPELESP